MKSSSKGRIRNVWLIFIGCMFIGGGIGLLVGNLKAGGAIGMGVGFISVTIFNFLKSGNDSK